LKRTNGRCFRKPLVWKVFQRLWDAVAVSPILRRLGEQHGLLGSYREAD
jgi:hypothetical protein